MYLLLYLGNYSGYLCTGHCEISRSTVDSSNISRHITSLLTPLSWQPWLTILKLLRFLLTDPRATCSLLISDTACNIIMITWSVLCISLFLHSTDIYYHVKFSPCTWLVHGMDGHYKNVLNEDKHSEKSDLLEVSVFGEWGRDDDEEGDEETHREQEDVVAAPIHRLPARDAAATSHLQYLHNIYTISKQYLDIIYTVSTDYLNRHLAPDAAASLQTMCWHYSLPHQYLWTEHKKYHKLFLYSIFST